jgi:hypothetical protein
MLPAILSEEFLVGRSLPQVLQQILDLQDLEPV